MSPWLAVWFKDFGLNFLFNCTWFPLGPCVTHWANSGLDNRSVLLSHGSFDKIFGIGGTNRLPDQDQFLLARVRRESHRNSIVNITACFPFVEHLQHFASNNCAGENRSRCNFLSAGKRSDWLTQIGTLLTITRIEHPKEINVTRACQGANVLFPLLGRHVVRKKSLSSKRETPALSDRLVHSTVVFIPFDDLKELDADSWPKTPKTE